MNRNRITIALVFLLLVGLTACTQAGTDPDSIVVDGSKHVAGDQIWEKETFRGLTKDDLQRMSAEGITGSVGITQTAVYAVDLVEHEIDLDCSRFFILQDGHIIGMFEGEHGEQFDYYPDGYGASAEPKLKADPDTEYILGVTINGYYLIAPDNSVIAWNGYEGQKFINTDQLYQNNYTEYAVVKGSELYGITEDITLPE